MSHAADRAIPAHLNADASTVKAACMATRCRKRADKIYIPSLGMYVSRLGTYVS